MTTTHDALRKLAEAVIAAEIEWDAVPDDPDTPWRDGELAYKSLWKAKDSFIAASNPKTVIELLDEIADLRISVVAYLGPHAAFWAEANGQPNYLHPRHYDLLEKCGARMVDFKRYEAKP